MTSPVTIYRTDTGEIVSSGGILLIAEFRDAQISAALAPWGSDNHDLLEVASDPNTQYVQVFNGVEIVVDKAVLQVAVDKTAITADGEDFATLTGLPNPCEIIIDDPDPTVETTTTQVFGGGFEFAAATPGVYTIEVRRFPFLPWKVEITAT
jgi:hypothetical protein